MTPEYSSGQYVVSLNAGDVERCVERFVWKRGKIEGIKALRTEFGIALKMAKDLYELAEPRIRAREFKSGTRVVVEAKVSIGITGVVYTVALRGEIERDHVADSAIKIVRLDNSDEIIPVPVNQLTREDTLDG